MCSTDRTSQKKRINHFQFISHFSSNSQMSSNSVPIPIDEYIKKRKEERVRNIGYDLTMLKKRRKDLMYELAKNAVDIELNEVQSKSVETVEGPKELPSETTYCRKCDTWWPTRMFPEGTEGYTFSTCDMCKRANRSVSPSFAPLPPPMSPP